MKTIKLPYSQEDPAFEAVLRELRRVQSSIYRVAYNQASEGLAEIEIRAIYGDCKARDRIKSSKR